MPPVLVIHISDLEAQGVGFHHGNHFIFQNHQLRKGQSFSATIRSQALSLAEQYQNRGNFCILVEQDGMLTLCREESPTLVNPAPTPPVTPDLQERKPPTRQNFLFAPKPKIATLPESYRNLPPADQELAQLLTQVRREFSQLKMRSGSLTWNYWVGGAGQTGVLFLPGTVHLGDMWFPYLHHWQGEFRLLAPTYPAASSIEQLVEGIRQLLKQEQLRRVHIIGQSLGGMVALALLRKYPTLVDKVVLSHTGVGVPGKERVAETRRIERQLQGMTERQITTQVYQSIINKHLVNVPHQKFWQAYFREALTQHTSKIAFISLNCRVVADFFQHYHFQSSSLNDPPRPVLIVNTDNDRTFDPAEQAALTALFPNAQTLTCTGTGHYSLLVASDGVMPALAEFLR